MNDLLNAVRGALIGFAVLTAISAYGGDSPNADLLAPPDTAKGRDPIGTEVEKTLNSSSDGKPVRLREGFKLVDQLGEFQRSGDQYSFFAKETYGVLRVLENLALERVARVLDDNPSMRVWSVTGVVTEYRNENYLLITRAVLKAQPKKNLVSESQKVETESSKAGGAERKGSP